MTSLSSSWLGPKASSSVFFSVSTQSALGAVSSLYTFYFWTMGRSLYRVPTLMPFKHVHGHKTAFPWFPSLSSTPLHTKSPCEGLGSLWLHLHLHFWASPLHELSHHLTCCCSSQVSSLQRLLFQRLLTQLCKVSPFPSYAALHSVPHFIFSGTYYWKWSLCTLSSPLLPINVREM